VLFVIITDGQENNSTKYALCERGRERVFQKVTHQREKYAWEFVFLGANQDAYATATGLGIAAGNNVTYNATKGGTEEELANANLTAVANHLGQLAAWQEQAKKLGRKLPVVLHVDSGLNRLGMPFTETKKLSENLNLLEGLDLKVIMSHLAIPALASHPMNKTQLENFKRALSILPKTPASLAASSGSFLGRDYLFDMARIGSSIYGMNPMPNKPNPMRAVARLEFPVLQVQEIEIGETVGYGCTFKADRKTRIATLGGGFSDGYMRSLSNSGTIWIGDYRCPVVGRVSMDLITIDVTDIPAQLVQPGQMMAILHDHYTVNHLAGEAKTRTTEILCGLGRKPKRNYINAQ
jgi:alanine racemase